MHEQDSVFSPNLAGIEVGETRISDVNGEAGRLTYRGHDIAELIKRPFWQVAWLVIFGHWPGKEHEARLIEFMTYHSRLNSSELALLETVPDSLHPMLVLQGIVPLISYCENMELEGVPESARHGLMLAAKLPTLVAARRQLELGRRPIAPNVNAAFHENFLTMFNGGAPTPEQVHILDVTQILQMEHSFNAGTFAGRVCASTRAPIQSSLSASIGTLYGELHGGADQAALEMAKKIGSPDKAAAFVRECLKDKVRIMGMGHREYKVLDPRAAILKPMAKELCSDGEAKVLFETLEAVEAACIEEFDKRDKQIRANVEFYKGAVFNQLGIPPHYFTALFAMARIYGWIAHFLEFNEDPALIRPKARYIGN